MADRYRRRDAPWVMRTYSGHSTARASNEFFRTNMAKGQTGLSIAFDLPTQTGYDPDAPEAAGEVGKVGVPVAHLGHMHELLDQIPVSSMNTSMTINATAAWLLGLYVANAQDLGVDPAQLAGTTQNDIVKEYLSRGTYIFPPGPSLRLTVDTIAYTVRQVPKWNPINVCSYHLQEAGATPVQEIAYALATAIGVLDGVRDSGKIEPSEIPAVVGRISFFVNSSVRFVEETCKMRAFTQLWDRICRERYDVADPKLRRFRYGVQVNSLGLTEQQPENNVQRIVLEQLGVTLSKSARARALQLPAWNEALGLPRPWDQQWSLRMQQVLAFESDLLEYDDIFEGSHVIEAKTAELAEAAWAELADVQAIGRRLRGHRRAQAPPGAQPGRAGAAYRARGAEGGRRELLHRDRAVAAARRRRGRQHPQGRPPGRGRADRGRGALAGRARLRRRAAAPRRAAPGGRGRRPRGQRHGGHHRPGPCRRHHRRMGRRAARGLRRVPGPDRCRRRRGPSGPRHGRRRRRAPWPWPSAPAGRRASSWPSRGSTATPTGPSRSPWLPATPGSRSSTRASGSPRTRSSPPPGTRTSTSWASPSSRARISTSCPRSSTACGQPGSTAAVVVGGIIPPDDAEILRRQGRGGGLHAEGLLLRAASWRTWWALARAPAPPPPLPDLGGPSRARSPGRRPARWPAGAALSGRS